MINLYRTYAIGPIELTGFEAVQVAIVLVLVLVLVALWTFGIPGRIWSRLTRKKTTGIPDLDPIENLAQINYIIALRSAGRMTDRTWSRVVPLVENYLTEHKPDNAGRLVEVMETFGKGLLNGRG